MDDRSSNSVGNLTAEQRSEAMSKFTLLQPHLEGDTSLAQIASDGKIPIRTVQRWLARYRVFGLAGLARARRGDTGRRKIPAELVELVEGMALRKPRPSVATIFRRVTVVSKRKNWHPPSYASVYAIVSSLDPAMMTLAHEGQAAYRNRFELAYRTRAEKPNSIWQADHTQLDILVLEATGTTQRPWLTIVLDDHSRAVAGYTLFLGAPSALQTSLALRQAIWRKQDPSWPLCGIPDRLYVDHGSDFTSIHLGQVAAELHFELVYSAVGRPQGRGKIERFFGTLNTEVLAELPGHLRGGKPATPPKLSLQELDAAIRKFIIESYNCRPHSETNVSPNQAWLKNGWLPRMPESLEELDMLLVLVATPRKVHRDGIYFQGLRFIAPTLAAYVGEPVTIRYDPRDLGEIRVFHSNRFVCRAIDVEHAGQDVSLKDIQAARIKYRRALRSQINEKIKRVAEFLPSPAEEVSPPQVPAVKSGRKLRLYLEGS